MKIEFTSLSSIFLVIATCCLGQTIPDSVDPARLGERLSQPEAPLPQKPEIEVPVATEPEQLIELENIEMNLKSIEISGNTIYKNGELEDIYQKYLGKQITFKELSAIGQSIRDFYRNNGYVLATLIIPPQELDKENADVKFIIFEGDIDTVLVQGDKNYATSIKKLIRKHAKAIKSSSPLNIKELEWQVLLLNDIPGIKARTVIKPSMQMPGSTDIELIIDQDQFNAYIATDNRGTKYIGPEYVKLGADIYSLFGPNQISFNIATTYDLWNEVQYYDLSYAHIISSKGTSIKAITRHTTTNPGYTLEALNNRGDSSHYELQLSHPLLRRIHANANLETGFYIVNNESSLETSSSYDDHIRAAFAKISGNKVWPYRQFLTFDLGITQGFNFLGASSKGDSHISRPLAGGNFTHLDAEASFTKYLPRSFSLQTGFKTQYAFQALLSSEQFSYGGSSYGRGFDPAEISGDSGINAKLELRYDYFSKWKYINWIQGYTFYDVGKV